MTAVVTDLFPDSWEVREEHGLWVAWHPDQGYLHDLTCADYPARYGTRAEVLEHLGVAS